MKKLYSLACLLSLAGIIRAQISDSNELYLGNMSLRNEFTQQVRIKASDLEKLPFTNLSEAISSWLYGSFSTKGNLSFVINGRVVTDVNSYSIQEIDEIILIQNALAHLNGSKNQQQLVVIKLKNEKQASGFTLSGKTHLAQINDYAPGNPHTSSYKNLYHEYFVSADRTSKKAQYGIAAGFLHDVSPMLKSDQIVIRSPNHIDRYHANAYLTLALSPVHELSVNLNYLHQPSKQETTWDIGSAGRHYFDFYGKDANLHSGLVLKSVKSKFANRFSASYTFSTLERNDFRTYSADPLYSSTSTFDKKYKNLLLQNETKFAFEANGLQVSPALNLSYRYLRERNEQEYLSSTFVYRSASKLSGGKLLLTPAVDLNYRNALHIKGGMVTDVSEDKYQTFFPFVTTTVNLFELPGKPSIHRLKFFGSYSKAGYFLQHAYQISDLTRAAWVDAPAGWMTGLGLPFAASDSGTNKIQAGTNLSLLKNRINLGYNFERTIYNDYLTIYFWGGNFYELHQIRSRGHRFSMKFSILEKDRLSWTSQASFTSIKSEIQLINPGQLYVDYIYGDVAPEDRSWTGGWNNRIRVNKFFAGFDLIYHTGQVATSGSAPQKRDLFSLNYAFLGFTFGPKFQNTEIFFSGRNLYRDHDFITTIDARKYYGLGFKMGL